MHKKANVLNSDAIAVRDRYDNKNTQAMQLFVHAFF